MRRCAPWLHASLLLALCVAASAAMPVPKPPDIDARAYLLVDFHSGKVLADRDAAARMEPASITKLMTAYVVFEAIREGRLQLHDSVLVSEHAWRAEGSRSFIKVGASVPVDILLKGMIIQSGNDAAIALAERVGGSEDGFASMMNSYAGKLGLTNSHFRNSTGLPDPEHYMSAADIAELSAALIRDFPEYYRWYSQPEFTWNGIRQRNRNDLLGRDPSVDGIKTGHTESAGYCLVTSADRNGMRLISVVLGTASEKARADASAALLNFGYTFYETVRMKAAGEKILVPQVYKGATDAVDAITGHELWVTVPRGTAAALTTRASARDPLIAPFAAGDDIGEITVLSGEEVVAQAPLQAATAVAAGGWWGGLVDTIALWFH
ncbi:MAG: D-alanyl-D-alanine carboxypeptidase family protein [Steroidobacteraceae bacterium]